MPLLDKLRRFFAAPEARSKREAAESRAPDVPEGDPREVAGAAEPERRSADRRGSDAR